MDNLPHKYAEYQQFIWAEWRKKCNFAGMKSDRQILDSEYNEILLQTVAVIEKSRSMLAVQVSTIASNSYFGIGQILYERKLESKYGDAVVRRLSVDLPNL